MHRLTAEKRNGQSSEFSYDPLGNRIEDSDNGKTMKLAYTTGNRQTLRGDVKMTLDGRGNLIEETETGTGTSNKTSRRFEYNTANRLTDFYKDGQLSAQYHYNANGLRDRKTLVTGTPMQSTQFAYAPDTRLLSAVNQTQTTHYLWLGAAPVAQIDKLKGQKGSITYLHADHLLTPRVATNEQQKIVWRWQSYVNQNPLAMVDPLGLFKVKVEPTFISQIGFGDAIHETIVLDAFKQFNSTHQVDGHDAFSKDMIDLFIAANVRTDLIFDTNHQFSSSNHFDNPNDTPWNQASGSATWIANTIASIQGKRSAYSADPHTGCTMDKKGIFDISTIVEAFGQNSHTIADFYAHSNWVDDPSREGVIHKSTSSKDK